MPNQQNKILLICDDDGIYKPEKDFKESFNPYKFNGKTNRKMAGVNYNYAIFDEIDIDAMTKAFEAFIKLTSNIKP